MLTITDFQRGDNRYEDFVTERTLWGERLAHKISVSFAEKLGKTEETLAAALPTLNAKLAFIEENEAAVKQSAAYLHELAEDWLYELVENEDDTEVELEDGKMVSVDVSPECFMASLYPMALDFKFKESTEICEASIELCCDPDYFAGHRIHIEINGANEIECNGI